MKSPLFPQKCGDSAAEASWREEESAAQVTEVLYETGEDGSLFQPRGSRVTLAKATHSVDHHGLEERLPLPAVSHRLALPGQAHYITEAEGRGPVCLPGNYLQGEPALPGGSL